MKLLILCLFMLYSCGQDEKQLAPKPDIRKSDSEGIALMQETARQLRGYQEINHFVSTELIKDDHFDIALYLGERQKGEFGSTGYNALHYMLGSRRSDGMRTTVNGSEPNAMNMLLWNIVISSLATDIEAWCWGRENEMNQKITLTDDFSSTLQNFCQRDNSSADNLPELYNAVIGIQKTKLHEQSWVQFHKKYLHAEENKKQVHSLIYSLMYSTEFLVRR